MPFFCKVIITLKRCFLELLHCYIKQVIQGAIGSQWAYSHIGRTDEQKNQYIALL